MAAFEGNPKYPKSLCKVGLLSIQGIEKKHHDDGKLLGKSSSSG
jgi:hypothetical protein